MKKCIVISDSFKGSLPSRDICAIARERQVNKPGWAEQWRAAHEKK